MAAELVKVEHISKSFSGVAALDDVRFDLYSGEVHA
jgi:ABC-type sugar transport system ATPase subunit